MQTLPRGNRHNLHHRPDPCCSKGFQIDIIGLHWHSEEAPRADVPDVADTRQANTVGASPGASMPSVRTSQHIGKKLESRSMRSAETSVIIV
jgi:hypothetical protein